MSDQEHGAYDATGRFTWRQAIRAHEPGATGRLGVGNLLRYCEIIANGASALAGFDDAWYLARGDGWVIFRQTIELAAAIGIGEQMDGSTWVRAYSRVSAQRDYQLRHAATGHDVARVATTWAYVDRARQTPRRIPAEILEQIPILPHPALRERVPWGISIGDPPRAMVSWRARTYEADRLRHINNCVYADWLGEAAALACADWATGADDLAAVCRRTLLPRRMSITYQRSALPGDEIAITTLPERLGDRGIVLAQTITLAADPAAPLVTATATYIGM